MNIQNTCVITAKIILGDRDRESLNGALIILRDLSIALPQTMVNTREELELAFNVISKIMTEKITEEKEF